MTEVSIRGAERFSTAMARRLSPAATLAAVPLALACLLLLLHPALPIGPFYWDLVLYLDAANRILDGQLPSIDFFAPVGPLGYWLFALLLRLFPGGQPLLIAQWSLLLVTAPLFAPVLTDVGRRSRGIAWVLLLPFLLFSVLPFNVEEFYSYPGVDGFGIYNRQCCLILYVLGAALVFGQRRGMMLAVVAGSMLALFLTKITGFVSGGMICLFAFAAGRIGWRMAAGAALAALLVLAGLEAISGIVSAYLGDILALVRMNEESLLPRFLQAASVHAVVVLPAAALTGYLLAIDAADTLKAGAGALRRPAAETLGRLFDRDAFWLAAFAFAALFFETQNTGGLAFVFLWPVLLAVLAKAGRLAPPALAVLLALVAATALPTLMEVVQKAARSAAGQMKYQPLAAAHLKSLGLVSQRPEMMARADRMIETYRRFPATYGFIADRGELPSLTLYAEADYQLAWLKTVDEAAGAILDLEARSGARFETIMSLNFANPFPWLLDRHAPKGLAIGADPGRAVPAPGSAVMEAVRAADLVLSPKCPITTANRMLFDIYRPGLANHRLIALSPCWDAFVREGLIPEG